MTTESAMDELLNVGHDFFAFRSIETGELLNTSRGTPGASQTIPRADSPSLYALNHSYGRPRMSVAQPVHESRQQQLFFAVC
jgi:hypothetical protein